MIRYRIRLSSTAARQIERASAWWRKHRHKAPGAFDDDLDAALRAIRERPRAGQRVASRKPARRFWLARIGYFLYYREPNDDGVIVIQALCHAARGKRPRL